MFILTSNVLVYFKFINHLILHYMYNNMLNSKKKLNNITLFQSNLIMPCIHSLNVYTGNTRSYL